LQEADYEQYKFQAGLQGIDLDKQTGNVSGVERETKGNVFTFQDPKNYEKMTKEEREQLTHKMMQGHKQWMNEKTENDLGKG